MKYIFIALSLYLFACNGSKTNSPAAAPTEEIKTPTTPEPMVDNGPENYFTATGSDWSVDLKSAMNGTFPVVLIQNNGKDTLRTVLNRKMEGNAKPASGKSSVNFIGVIEGADKGEAMELGITPGACVGKGNGGEKTNFTCKISIGKKSLSGCGNYSEN